jgi:uncharacterized protein (TIGR03435 family)
MTRLLAGLLIACTLFGQATNSPAPPLPEFDAVSIKPNKSGDSPSAMRGAPGGRLTATNVRVRQLITWAYQVRDFQISGEPAWVDSERYDVVTKSEGNPRFDFIQPTLETMFQGVLADRFKLALHRETKELPVYTLVVAKNGPKIHAVDEGDCPEVPTQQNPCRSLRNTKFGQLTGEKAPMAAITLMLAVYTGRTVLDKTGLKGSFSFTLDWTRYLEPPPSRGGDQPLPAGAFDPASVEPAISTALQEQLGLKLESGKGPVEILVIDHVERPSEN